MVFQRLGAVIRGALTPALAAAFFLAAGGAQAQGLVNFGNNPGASVSYNAIFSRPTVSPYLNLTSAFNGGGGGLNYFTLVQPQLHNRAVQQAAGQEIQSLQRQISTATRGRLQQRDRELAPTGIVAQFRYYGSYYPGLNRR